MEGLHCFQDELGNRYGSFEVFWSDYLVNQDEEDMPPGWYWWPCFPGCLPDGEPMGPFKTSRRAYADAMDRGM